MNDNLDVNVDMKFDGNLWGAVGTIAVCATAVTLALVNKGSFTRALNVFNKDQLILEEVKDNERN